MMTTTAIPISCNNCGGALEIEEGVRFITCTYCLSRLEVKNTENAIYCEILEAVSKRAGTISSDLDLLIVHNEIERLDREWEKKRGEYVTQVDGEPMEPNHVRSVLLGLIAVVSAIALVVAVTVTEGPWFVAITVSLLVPLCIYSVWKEFRRVNEWQAAKTKYEEKRVQLEEELDELERTSQARDSRPTA